MRPLVNVPLTISPWLLGAKARRAAAVSGPRGLLRGLGPALSSRLRRCCSPAMAQASRFPSTDSWPDGSSMVPACG